VGIDIQRVRKALNEADSPSASFAV